MSTTHRRRSRPPALLGAALLLLAAAATADEDTPPPPPADGPGAVAPVPSPGTGDGKLPPADHKGEAPPPETLEQAWNRVSGLRQMPLRGPGSMGQRLERIRTIAEAGLSLPAAAAARGEDLYRLGELAFVTEDFPRAAAAFASYLGTVEKPLEGPAARSGRVRVLARAGRTAEAREALEAAIALDTGNDLLPHAAMALGDALVREGAVEKALGAYRTARTLGLRSAGRVGLASAAQCESEVLVALGRIEEAMAVLDETASVAGAGEGLAARLGLSKRRVAMAGKPFAPPSLPRWSAGEPPAEDAFKGRVVVWHVYAPWMDVRLPELDQWIAEAKARPDLVLVPFTRTSGWVSGAPALEPGARPPAREADEILALLEKHGFKGNAAVAYGPGPFDSLGVRGLPMDIVVGTDGRILFVRASGEAGPALALWVARRALDAAAKAPPAESPAGGTGTPSGESPATPR